MVELMWCSLKATMLLFEKCETVDNYYKFYLDFCLKCVSNITERYGMPFLDAIMR